MKKLNRALSGNAGVYFAAGELTRQGYVATITSRNTKGIDILVSNENATKTIGIQVKTNQSNAKWWLLSKSAENYFAANLFYVFVNLNNGEKPDFFIVPSKIVANHIRERYKKWLFSPSHKGKPHKDNPMREFHDKEKHYINRWGLLEL